MISANNVTLRIGKKALFEDVNIKFTEGNCYGLIGANGAGKSTFLKILTGQIEPSKGDVSITPGQRLSFLEQDHFKYDDCVVLDTVIRGNERLYEIMKEKEAIYAKEDFTEEDGNKASELEAEFADMNGWEAESDAAQLLNGLGVTTDLHYKLMSELNGSEKVKVLLAKALFGNPDILLLDEPRHGLHDHLRLLSAQEREYVPHRGDGLAVGHYGGRPFGTGHFPRRLLVRHLAHLGSGAGFFDAAERFRPDERGLCDLGRIFRPAVLGRNHLVGLAARSHHRLPVGRNAHHAVESHRLHGLYRSRNRIAQRAVDDARFGPDYRRKKSVRSVRQPVVEPDDAAGRSVHRAVRRLGAIAPKAARRNDQRTEIRDPRLPGRPIPDPVRHPRSDRYPVRQPDRAAVLKEPARQRMRRRNSAATTAVAIATFSDSDVGAAPG